MSSSHDCVLCCVCKSALALTHTARRGAAAAATAKRRIRRCIYERHAARVCDAWICFFWRPGGSHHTRKICSNFTALPVLWCVHIFSLANVYHTHAHHTKHALAFDLCTFLMLCVCAAESTRRHAARKKSKAIRM